MTQAALVAEGAATLKAIEPESLAVRVSGLPAEQIEVLRQTVCKDLNDSELLLFLARCHRKGLDPFDQVSVWKGSDGKMAMQVRIDGLRALSRRSGQFGGRTIELIYKPDDPKAIIGARCTVWRKDVERPFVEEALLSEYHKGGTWDRLPETMIRKVAESKALRAAFPEELAGWYEPAELE